MTDEGAESETEGHGGKGYVHESLEALKQNSEKPGSRWEISPQLGIEGYNFNVAVLEPGQRLSQNAYHYHRDQSEFYYVVSGRLRVEVEERSFDVEEDEVLLFEEGVPHLLHNCHDEPCKIIAIGYPPEGRYPVEQVQSYDDLLAERYGEDA